MEGWDPPPKENPGPVPDDIVVYNVVSTLNRIRPVFAPRTLHQQQTNGTYSPQYCSDGGK